jgi:crotonobetainyl-CoA:carnitine CoA-transferase CaiB-like acyl-CoA transferase
MQEAIFPALASNLGMMYSQDGAIPPRTANRHGGLSVCPYNVYEAKDGHIAINCVKEIHWQGLLKIMQREDLRDDPRFTTNKDRVENMDETDALVEAWSRTRDRADIIAAARSHRLPIASVRNLVEVANDPHMHERGMLEWMDHPEYGRVVVPTNPMRFHEADRVALTPSPRAGQHNDEIYSDWLGLSANEIDQLRKDGVI